jgi:hypothetical protein
LFGYILRRICLPQQVIEGKIKGGIERTWRRGRRRRKLLDDLKERRGYSYLKEEALDGAMWRTRFGRDFGPVVRQTDKWMNELCCKHNGMSSSKFKLLSLIGITLVNVYWMSGMKTAASKLKNGQVCMFYTGPQTRLLLHLLKCGSRSSCSPF